MNDRERAMAVLKYQPTTGCRRALRVLARDAREVRAEGHILPEEARDWSDGTRPTRSSPASWASTQLYSTFHPASGLRPASSTGSSRSSRTARATSSTATAGGGHPAGARLDTGGDRAHPQGPRLLGKGVQAPAHGRRAGQGPPFGPGQRPRWSASTRGAWSSSARASATTPTGCTAAASTATVRNLLGLEGS